MDIFTTLLIKPLANGLILFYKIFFSNMGLAIIGFSTFLRYLLNPLTKPYMESMKKMKDFGPQLEKLKTKYKDDKQKLMQAQADFYKEKGINPGAGCLPYILQIVVLIALFNVFTRALSTNGDSVSKFNQLLYAPLKFAANEVVNTKFLYLDMTKPDTFQLPNLPFSLPGPLLLLAALAQVFSAKMMAPAVAKENENAKKTPQKTDDFSAAMQQSSLITFPLLTIVFGMKFPSGLALYWFLFSLFQVFQQYKSSGWGGAQIWINKASLIKSKIIRT